MAAITSRKPLWRRWWMIIIYVCVVIFLFLIIAAVTTDETEEPTASAPAAQAPAPTAAPAEPAVETCPTPEEQEYIDRSVTLILMFGDQAGKLADLSNEAADDIALVADERWLDDLENEQEAMRDIIDDIVSLKPAGRTEAIQYDLRLMSGEYKAGMVKYMVGVKTFSVETIRQSLDHRKQAIRYLESATETGKRICG